MNVDHLLAAAGSLRALALQLRAASATPAPVSTIQKAAPYVLIEKAAELTGYTKCAIDAKIAQGQWLEGREWVKAPDGHRMINIK